MIDLHCHLLPGVDDGSRSVDQSVGVLREMARLGVTDVCLTPHFLASRAAAGVPPVHNAAFTSLTAAAPVPPRLHRGAEVMLDRPVRASEVRHLTLAGSRYLLVEFPRLIAEEAVRNALEYVVATRFVPVVAHPERYSSCSVRAAQGWRATGAKLQVDATTLLSPRGRGERARRLVAAGLADIIAADNHGDGRQIAAGYQALLELGGDAQAELLARENPRAIIDDRALTPVPPMLLRTSLMQRLRRFFEVEP